MCVDKNQMIHTVVVGLVFIAMRMTNPAGNGLRAAPSTESSRTSCCRAETSPEETGLAG